MAKTPYAIKNFMINFEKKKNFQILPQTESQFR